MRALLRLFEYLTLSALALLFLAPVVMMIVGSLKADARVLVEAGAFAAFFSADASLQNYADVFARSDFLRFLGNSLLITGSTVVAGQIVNDLPPQRRNVAMVFQNYALYPHMTVHQNLAFPLRMQKLSRAEIDRRVEQTAALLNLSPLLSRRPRALSGGQRQRVAMGRAIIREAALFLMDEPLSNLDARLRVQIRTEIAALQARLGMTILYVTHDQTEAMTLGRRVAVMRDGRLQQVVPPHELYSAPANIFVAGFIGSPGMNILRAGLTQRGGVRYLRLGAQSLRLTQAVIERHAGLADYAGDQRLVGIRPESLAPVTRAGDDCFSVSVAASEALGHETLLHTRGDVTTVATDTPPGRTGESQPHLVAACPGHCPRQRGERLHLRPDPERLHLFGLDGVALHG